MAAAGEIDFRAEVAEIYARLEHRRVERDCVLRGGCCHFRLTGRAPHLTRGEALVAADGVRAAGHRRLPQHPDGACPMLGRDGRCRIYDQRPFGCRTHFCEAAGGMLPRALVRDLIQRLEHLDSRLGGDGPKRFETAIREVMMERRP